MEELSSPLASVIQSYQFDPDTTIMLDNMVNKLVYLNSMLDYDPDYDIQVFLDNSLSDEHQLEEQEEEVLPLYPRLREYAVEMLRRFGIFLKDGVVLRDMVSFLSSVEELINIDRESANEIKDIRANNIDKDYLNLGSIFDQFTSITEEEFFECVSDMNDKVLDYITYSDVEENVEDFDMTMINKLQVVNKDLLKAPILKGLIKLGNTRYPDIHQYLPIYSLYTRNKNDLTIELHNFFLVLMHVDKEFVIKYDIRDQWDPSYILTVAKDFIMETHDPDLFKQQLLKEIGKVRGLKL